MSAFNGYPFSAVAGQDKAKTALVISAVNPGAGGVLLCGEKGTAKSTLVRGLGELICEDVCELPLNVTEDMLVGAPDTGAAVTLGQRRLAEPLLKRADGRILYIDEVNLLPANIINVLAEVTSSGVVHVEREGLSLKYPSRFVLTASMNPEEGRLSPHFTDRFGMYAELHGEQDADVRCEIIRRRLRYEADPREFALEWRAAEEKLKKDICTARGLLPQVKCPDKLMSYAAYLSAAAGCPGLRGEIATVQAARALAAMEGSLEVAKEHIDAAAEYTLPHRMGKEAMSREEKQSPPAENCEDAGEGTDGTEKNETPCPEPPHSPNVGEEMWQDTEDFHGEIKVISPVNSRLKLKSPGKHTKAYIGAPTGRYVKHRIPDKKPEDIAVDATIRTAALHPPEPGMAITVRPEDIREKVRARRSGVTVMFLVDASGSMGAARRMGAVKGAILSMLTDAYERRDSVGMVAFRGTEAFTLLNITKSPALAARCLRGLKTGGRSPLAAGLLKAAELLRQEKIKNPDALQYLAVVTDGRANVPLSPGGSSEKDVQSAAEFIRGSGIISAVLDTEAGFIRTGGGKKLAEQLNGRHIPMPDLSANTVRDSIDGFLHS